MNVQEAFLINCRLLKVPITVDFETVRQYQHFHMNYEYVNIHNAGGAGSGENLHAYNKDCIRRGEYHPDGGPKDWTLSVGYDGAFQALPLDVNSWQAGDGAGDGNMKSASIEITGDMIVHNRVLMPIYDAIGADRTNYDTAEDFGLRVAAALLVANGLGIDRLRKHQDWSGKYCPHVILRENRWESVKQRVKAYMDEIARLEKQPEPTPEPAKEVWRVQLGAFNTKPKADMFALRCGKALIKEGVIPDDVKYKPYAKKG